MTKSTITRERIQRIIRAIDSESYDEEEIREWLTSDEIMELARMALAAMGSEPHTDDELSNLLWYSQEATCHSDPNYYCEFQRLATPGLIAGIIRELQERRKAEKDSEPVAWTDEQELRDVDRGGCGYLFTVNPVTPHADERRIILLYRHAQPAPVVPDESYQQLSELYHAQEKRLFKIAQRIKGPAFDKYSHSPSQAIDVLEVAIFGDDESCRAAMLNAQPQNAPQNIPEIIPDGWIPVSERMPEVGDIVLTAMGGVVNVGEMECSAANCRFFTSVISGRELPATHWMPLPAAPQEAQGE